MLWRVQASMQVKHHMTVHQSQHWKPRTLRWEMSVHEAS